MNPHNPVLCPRPSWSPIGFRVQALGFRVWAVWGLRQMSLFAGSIRVGRGGGKILFPKSETNGPYTLNPTTPKSVNAKRSPKKPQP